jgi:PAS domain S-box-containing protein
VSHEVLMLDLDGKKRILVVEDEKITAMDIRERLRGLGYDPLPDVSTGEEAIEVATELKPDLVLMDVILKGRIDGVEAASVIRERLRIPVIFLTAFSDDNTLQRAKVTEPYGYILKPFEERELHTTIEMALYKYRMEKDLRASEEKFAKAFQASPDAININRLSDGMYIEVNKGFQDLTGYTREEVIGKSSIDLNIWVNLADRERLVKGLKSDGEVTNLEAEFRLKDGSTRTGLMSAAVITVAGETCILSMVRDISERRKAERKIEESQQQLAGIIGSAMDGIITVDENQKIILFNRAAQIMFGCREEDALGQPLSRFLPERYRDAHNRHVCEFSKAHTTIRSMSSMPSLYGLKANGEEFPAEISISQVEIDHRRYFTAIVRDTTEKKAAESALRQSEHRYKEFFERDLTGNFVATLEGVILDCNPAFARMFKFNSVNDARQSTMVSLFNGPESWSDVVEILRSRNLEYHENERQDVDGKALYVIENLYGEKDEQGVLARVRGFIFDNTERKALEQQLLHAQRMESVGILASGVAHDFNNVLNNILGFAHQMKKHINDPVRLARYADTIEKSAARGADLANQLMLFVRKKKRENAHVVLEEVIQDILHVVQETFPKSIVVRKEIGANIKPVLGDRGELYQTLLNLCLNARDALVERPDDGQQREIVIRAAALTVGEDQRSLPFLKQDAPPQYGVEMSVTDNGVGIPAAIREKIFDPFFTTKERGKGTGLGLSVVYNIVKNHNGYVSVESDEGGRTTFSVLLPAVGQAGQKSEPHSSDSTGEAHNELVMVVDDEENMQQLGREVLEEAGYRVLVATNGREAVEMYRDRWKEIALVVLDLVMPEMDGGQAYLHLRSINPDVKAFFCTGYTQDAIITGLLEEHHLRALEKPFKPPVFLKMVRETIVDGKE